MLTCNRPDLETLGYRPIILQKSLRTLYLRANVGRVYTLNAWVSIMNVNKDMKERTCGYRICNTSQILIFGGHLKVREPLNSRVIS